VETIRFYERRGLLEPPPRGASGYRRFPPEAVARLRFIHQAQELGFSLREVADLLSLQITAGATCAEVRERARAKLTELRARQRALARIARALERRWPPGILDDPRVLHLWDERRLVGDFYAADPDYGAGDSTWWDTFLLYGPEATWEDAPSELLGMGATILWTDGGDFDERLEARLAATELGTGDGPLRLLLDAEPVAMQSLHFEYGWQEDR
jgi:DNA-binding transcriptional MerR regulator